MNKTIRTSFSLFLLLVLSACNLFGPPSQAVFETSVLQLTVQTQNNATTFNQPGEIITYQYVIRNNGVSPLAGPAIVTDAGRSPNCPAFTTIGNQDGYLDQNESVTCTALYTISQTDMTTGSVTNQAIATVGTINSNQTGITLTKGTAQPSGVLRLVKTASSQTYGGANQTIIFSFEITNTGTTALGPAQFIITDAKLGPSFNCGQPNTTLQPGQPITCSFTYTTTQNDMSLASIVNSATASGANHTSAPATVTVTNLLAPATQLPPNAVTPLPPSNLPQGTTIQHQVAVGEWLLQIVRCYGATFDEVRNANPQIADPNFILPSMTVTVPRIGSSGRIYGKPCITFHTVQSGDTWESIAQRYNADLAVLRRVNSATLAAGSSVKVPLNSAGGSGVVVTAAPTTGVTPGVTPNVTAAAPMRITFEGGPTASRIGVINPGDRVQYIFTAAQGQVLTLQLTANANEVSMGVTGPTGLSLKPQDSLYTWSTTLINGGDHTITLQSVIGTLPKSYTLQVTLTNPSAGTPAPAATATSTPSTPAAQSNTNPGETP